MLGVPLMQLAVGLLQQALDITELLGLRQVSTQGNDTKHMMHRCIPSSVGKRAGVGVGGVSAAKSSTEAYLQMVAMLLAALLQSAAWSALILNEGH